MPVRIAVLDDYQGVALQHGPWSELPDAKVTLFREHLPDPVELTLRLQGFDVLVAMRERTPLTRDVLAELPDLRLLVTTGMHNTAVDMGAAADFGITVCGTRSDPSGPAELTWALILGLARHLVAEDASVRRGGWQETVGFGLRGRTLGVIGVGRIGAQVARVGRAFDMRLVAWSQNLTPERAGQADAELVVKEQLLRSADIVSLHLRLSERTRVIIGPAELALMRPSAVLVNTSRGALVDEQALLAALREGSIAGAGLDTYWDEPLPSGHPISAMPNTLLTPHLGYVTDSTYDRFYGEAVEDVAAFLAGAPVRVLAAPTGGR